MSEPQYASAWPGLGGRVTQLKIEHRVQLFVCSLCASLVLDQRKHTAWHRQVAADG